MNQVTIVLDWFIEQWVAGGLWQKLWPLFIFIYTLKVIGNLFYSLFEGVFDTGSDDEEQDEEYEDEEYTQDTTS